MNIEDNKTCGFSALQCAPGHVDDTMLVDNLIGQIGEIAHIRYLHVFYKGKLQEAVLDMCARREPNQHIIDRRHLKG